MLRALSRDLAADTPPNTVTISPANSRYQNYCLPERFSFDSFAEALNQLETLRQ